VAEPRLDIKITTAADVRGAVTAEKALDGVAQASQRAGKGATWLNSSFQQVAAGSQKTAAGAQQVKGALDSFSRSAGGAAAVMGGLEAASAGGARGILGFANAIRPLIMLVRGAFAAAGPFGIAVTVIGTLVGLFGALRSRTSESGDEMGKAAKSSDALTTALQELEKASQATLKQHLADVAKLKTDYQELTGLMDAAAARVAREQQVARGAGAARLERDRAGELAGAKTDAEREKINAKYDQKSRDFAANADSAAIETDVAQANLRAENAEAAARDATAQQAQADASVRQASEAKSTASADYIARLEAARSASPDNRERAFAKVDEARGAFKLAEAAEGKAVAQAEEVRVQTQEVIVTAANLRTAAIDAAAQAPAQQQTVTDQKAAADVSASIKSPAAPAASASRPPDSADLQAQLSQVEDREFRDLRHYDHPERVRDRGVMDRLRGEIQERDAAMSAWAGAQASQSRTIRKQSDRIRDNRP
jgi:chemotaxis protein histidine kinase CheA